MKCAEPTVAERPAETNPEAQGAETVESILQLPLGLLGFEEVKRYVLLGSPAEAPFLWLQMAEDPNLAFLVVAPSSLMGGYNPEVSEEEVEFLGLEKPEDAIVLNIVTLHRDGSVTVNLKGPILVNRHSLVGKQVIPLNAANFSLQHPVTVAGV